MMKATSFMKSRKFLGIPGFFSRLKEKGALAKDAWGVIGSALGVQASIEVSIHLCDAMYHFVNADFLTANGTSTRKGRNTGRPDARYRNRCHRQDLTRVLAGNTIRSHKCTTTGVFCDFLAFCCSDSDLRVRCATSCSKSLGYRMRCLSTVRKYVVLLGTCVLKLMFHGFRGC